MARQLDLDRMRRRAQLVQDAEAERAAAAAAAAAWASPLGRLVVDLAEALGLIRRPAAPKFEVLSPIVPPLNIGPIRCAERQL